MRLAVGKLTSDSSATESKLRTCENPPFRKIETIPSRCIGCDPTKATKMSFMGTPRRKISLSSCNHHVIVIKPSHNPRRLYRTTVQSRGSIKNSATNALDVVCIAASAAVTNHSHSITHHSHLVAASGNTRWLLTIS